jgi:hypothetical protein
MFKAIWNWIKRVGRSFKRSVLALVSSLKDDAGGVAASLLAIPGLVAGLMFISAVVSGLGMAAFAFAIQGFLVLGLGALLLEVGTGAWRRYREGHPRVTVTRGGPGSTWVSPPSEIWGTWFDADAVEVRD